MLVDYPGYLMSEARISEAGIIEAGEVRPIATGGYGGAGWRGTWGEGECNRRARKKAATDRKVFTMIKEGG